jgi:hypothetical protein
MKREFLLMLVVVLLGFSGGVSTQQWLSADGSLGAPAYSFSAETDLGLSRKAATQLCLQNASDVDSYVCFDDGRLLTSGNTGGFSNSGVIAMNTTSGQEVVPFVYQDTTNDFAGTCAESSTLDMYIGTYAGDAALVPACNTLTTTYLHRYTYNGTNGSLSLLDSTGAAWGSTQAIGSTSATMAYTMSVGGSIIGAGAAATGGSSYITQDAADSWAYYTSGNLIARTRNKDLFEVEDGKYLLTTPKVSNVVGTECDASSETGRFVADYGDNRVYVCNYDGGSTWMYFDLTE